MNAEIREESAALRNEDETSLHNLVGRLAADLLSVKEDLACLERSQTNE